MRIFTYSTQWYPFYVKDQHADLSQTIVGDDSGRTYGVWAFSTLKACKKHIESNFEDIELHWREPRQDYSAVEEGLGVSWNDPEGRGEVFIYFVTELELIDE